MSWKRLIGFFAIGTLLTAPALAAPSASLSGVQNGSQYDWTLSFSPDASIFGNYPGQGTGDSLGVSIQIEVPAGSLIGGSSSIDLNNFQENLDGNDIITASFDPYTSDPSGISEGVIEYTSVASDTSLGFMGTTVDAIMVSLGSKFFDAAGEYPALTFSTTGDWVEFGGLIAQDNNDGDTTNDIYVVVPMHGDTGPDYSFADIVMDGVVDDLDLAAFFGQWGENPDSFADFNEDGRVDDLDLAAFFGQWSPAPGALAASNAVPEPSTIALVVFGLAAFGLAFRHK